MLFQAYSRGLFFFTRSSAWRFTRPPTHLIAPEAASCLEKMPSKVEFGRRLRWVLPPTGRIPSFEGWHRGLLSGSVAGRLRSPPLLIREKNIALRAYFKWYGSTVREFAAIGAAKDGG
jgi:hypothetical protein